MFMFLRIMSECRQHKKSLTIVGVCANEGAVGIQGVAKAHFGVRFRLVPLTLILARLSTGRRGRSVAVAVFLVDMFDKGKSLGFSRAYVGGLRHVRFMCVTFVCLGAMHVLQRLEQQ